MNRLKDFGAFEWGDDLPRLTGPRLHFRSLRAADAPAILATFGDPEVMRFWSSPPLRDLSEAEDLIARIRMMFESRDGFQWGICARDSDEVLGTCTLFRVEPAHRRAEVGYALRRSAWGSGFGKEALDIVAAFAFDTLKLHRLEADVDPENLRSLRLLEGRGFQREGMLRERWHHLGEIRDAVFLGLLRRDWTGAPERAV